MFVNKEEVRAGLLRAILLPIYSLADKHLLWVRCNPPCQPKGYSQPSYIWHWRSVLHSSGLLVCERTWRPSKGEWYVIPPAVIWCLFTHRNYRYCNMDYIFMSAVIAAGILRLIASYDNTCQWIKNLWTCMEKLPEHLHLKVLLSDIITKIPKFHFNSHGKKNHVQYSFAFTQGAGQTDGEGWCHTDN
jgi:hypothetical protein